MADHGTVELGTATGTDFADHRSTYLGFLKLLKWSAVGVIVIVILVFWLLA
jgi:hypothetical protein